MTITKTINDNIAALVLSGRLDSITSNQLAEEIEVILNDGSCNLLLNFEEIDYVSSAGLRVIINTQKRISAIGRKMEITKRTILTYLLFGSKPAMEGI